MTTTEPTPEAVEALARELDDLLDIGKYAMGDAPTSLDYASVFLRAGYVDHGTYVGAAMARDASEQMHDRLEAENERLRQALDEMVPEDLRRHGENCDTEMERLRAQVAELQAGLPAAYGGEHDRRRAAEAKVARVEALARRPLEARIDYDLMEIQAVDVVLLREALDPESGS